MAKSPTIALCMIAKDCAESLERALESTKGVFDGYFLQDTGSQDNTVEVFEKWCKDNKRPCKWAKKFVGKDYKSVEVDGRELLGDFAHARNDSFSLADSKHDYAFWMDSDDILIGAEFVQETVSKMYGDNVDLGFMTYVYARGGDGLKPVVQKRERIISLKKPGKWKNRVHENYEIEGVARITQIENIQLEHLRTPFEALSTGRRNNLIMTAQAQEEGIDKFPDNMLHNLAFDHWEHKELDKAVEYYNLLLLRESVRQSPELVYNSTIKLAQAYIMLNKPEDAIIHGLRMAGFGMEKRLAEPFIVLMQAYAGLGSWDEAKLYAERVLEFGIPNTPAPINEYDYLVAPRRVLKQYYISKGDLESAIEQTNKILEFSPTAENRAARFQLLEETKARSAIDGVLKLGSYLQSTNQIEMMDRLKTSIPLAFKDDENVRRMIKELSTDFRRKTYRKRLSGKKSIVIYAGGHFEAWDGDSDKNKGIGGSEGMCIQMSRELAKLGNDVYVYNECGASDGKVFDGVTYIHHSKWNQKIGCDVFISLRRPDIFTNLIRADKQYLWLHDTGYGDDLPTGLFYAPDKIFVLSEAHKEVIKESHGIQDESVFHLTRNGLNANAVKYGDDNAIERDPNQIIYASSYDRGLENVLKMWPKIKTAVPEATLKILYGWNTFDGLMKQRAGTPRGKWMEDYRSRVTTMIEDLKPLSVVELGRVSQNEVYMHFAESGIWFYPTEFYEISCINAMTAQAMGAIPVCSNYAALNETVNGDYGIRDEVSNLRDAVIYLLQNKEETELKRGKMMKWARKAFNMKSLAKEWDKFLNED